jgi:hypothetical protein
MEVITLPVSKKAGWKKKELLALRWNKMACCYVNATIGFSSAGGPQKTEAKEHLFKY